MTTPNINRIKTSNGKLVVTANQSVPRGQLHKETVYGKSKQYECKYIKLGAATTLEEINAISNRNQRDAVLNRLAQFDGDIAKAFSGKNALKKNPIFTESPSNTRLVLTKTILLVPGLLYNDYWKEVTPNELNGTNMVYSVVVANNFRLLNQAKDTCNKR